MRMQLDGIHVMQSQSHVKRLGTFAESLNILPTIHIISCHHNY